MTNRETLRSLADACEALGGPCRETDALIADVTMERFGFDHSYAAVREEWWQGKDGKRHYQPPAYTASIDSAMSLVPAGYRVMLSEWDDEAHLRPRGPWQAVLSIAGCGMCGFNGAFKTRCEHGTSPALALTAASLRAIGEGL